MKNLTSLPYYYLNTQEKLNDAPWDSLRDRLQDDKKVVNITITERAIADCCNMVIKLGFLSDLT